MTEVIKFVEPWGFSKLDVFRACKAKFKYQFINKIPQPQSPALKRGSDVHDQAEAFLRGWVTDVTPPLDIWKERLQLLKLNPSLKTECNWGFDKNWKLLLNWFEPETWLRSKADAFYLKDDTTLVVIDFKTGKFREPSKDQIELYAICGAAIYPQVEQVITEFWFLDQDQIATYNYTKRELEALRKKYELEAGNMYSNTVWEPKPGMECRWCPYSKTASGHCKY